MTVNRDADCYHDSNANPCPSPIGHLVELRATGTVWARPVCGNHAATRRQPTYSGDRVIFLADVDELRYLQTCGAWRITGYLGTAIEQRLCERTGGACPFPNTEPGTAGDGRRCAAEVEHGDPLPAARA